MKVILKTNVPSLGQKDDVKEVKPGFWRNFLMPQNMAVKATPELIKVAEIKREERIKEEKAAEEKLEKQLQKIKEKVLVFEVKAGKTGSLFAGIDDEKIAKALKEQKEVEAAPKFVELKEPIKKIGFYEVKIKDVLFKVEIKPIEV